MTPDAAADPTLVFAILGVVIALFVVDRLPMDVVAVMALVALTLSGVLTPAEALSGFGATVTVLIAALFVVGAALSRTGVAGAVGAWIAERGGAEPTRLLMMMMAAVAGLSAFMSSTGAVAVFIPIALDIATRTGTPPARLLMPLAFASLIGGMLTLIGTPPNLIANAALRDGGAEPFGFFAFTPPGLAVFAVCAALLVVLGPRLLARGAPTTRPRKRGPSAADLLAAHGLGDRLLLLRVAPGAPVAGRALAEAEGVADAGLAPLGIDRKSVV